MSGPTLHVFTDASFCDKSRVAVIGYWILCNDTFDQVFPLNITPFANIPTSNDAEISAAVAALETIRIFSAHCAMPSVHLYTDCHAVAHPQQYISSPLREQLAALKTHLNVTTHRVKGHVANKRMTTLSQRAFAIVDRKTRRLLRQLRKSSKQGLV